MGGLVGRVGCQPAPGGLHRRLDFAVGLVNFHQLAQRGGKLAAQVLLLQAFPAVKSRAVFEREAGQKISLVQLDRPHQVLAARVALQAGQVHVGMHCLQAAAELHHIDIHFGAFRQADPIRAGLTDRHPHYLGQL